MMERERETEGEREREGESEIERLRGNLETRAERGQRDERYIYIYI